MKSEIKYSEDIHVLEDPQYDKWCIHIICTSGSCSFNYHTGLVKFGKNDCVVIGYRASVSNVKPSKKLKVKIILATVKILQNSTTANNFAMGVLSKIFNYPVLQLTDQDASRLTRDMNQVAERLNEADELFSYEVLICTLMTMVYEIFSLTSKSKNYKEEDFSSYGYVGGLMRLLGGDSVKMHREVSYYASELNISAKHLSEIVKQKTGDSAIHLINHHAMSLILVHLNNPNKTLSQISDEFNFASLSYFSRFVKKQIGKSPKEYRASMEPKVNE